MEVIITKKENEDELIIGEKIFVAKKAEKEKSCQGCTFLERDKLNEEWCPLVSTYMDMVTNKCVSWNRKDHRNIVWELKEENKK